MYWDAMVRSQAVTLAAINPWMRIWRGCVYYGHIRWLTWLNVLSPLGRTNDLYSSVFVFALYLLTQKSDFLIETWFSRVCVLITVSKNKTTWLNWLSDSCQRSSMATGTIDLTYFPRHGRSPSYTRVTYARTNDSLNSNFDLTLLLL